MSFRGEQGRRATIAVVAAALSLGFGPCDDDGSGNPESELTLEQATATLEGAPPELAAVREQANQLLAGGREAFEARLEELRGTPVVVNKWASWCSPCRFEFPLLQSLAIEREQEVAFLGVDSEDSEDAARTFLGQLPLPYPSYSDPDGEIADSLDAGREFPATIFISSDGEVVFAHFGAYPDEEALAADIDRFAN